MGDSRSAMSEPLYSDSLVEIHADSITFNDYYFPRGDRTVPLDKIDGIYWWVPTWWSGKYRFWGTGDFRTWCPRDYHRYRRDKMFLITRKDRRVGCMIAISAGAHGEVSEVLGGRSGKRGHSRKQSRWNS